MLANEGNGVGADVVLELLDVDGLDGLAEGVKLELDGGHRIKLFRQCR